MNRIKNINQYIARAGHLRDQLGELAKDFARLHNEPLGSDEADELMHVILDGEDYQTAMERVIEMKKHRS
ncbi:hypothetical protein Mal15_22290 [Stieleria maiorica]|uniref:Uncharacterized protein n=1 Tax=Stieleria maiorica TaxID=2795974 RepID=A0A5B9MA64_9BACT|nr:hypothetical protein [Stieleria maiorica]QEF98181.1 hypothetical protein Mal15_22290 [Stieleria maiorica]